MSYITDDQISAEVWDGEPVPGPNTVSREKNEAWKRASYIVLSGFMRRGVDSAPLPDPFGDLERVQMKLYKMLVDGETPALADEDKKYLINRRYVRAPLTMHDLRRGYNAEVD